MELAVLPLVPIHANVYFPFSTGLRAALGNSPAPASNRGIADVIRYGSRGDVYGLIVSDAEEIALECLRRFDDLWPHERQHVLDLQLELSSEDGAFWTPFLDALVADEQWKSVAERFTAWGLRTDQFDALRNRVRSVEKWAQRERDWVLLLPLRAFRSPILIDALLSHARYLPAVALRELCMSDVRRLFSVARNPRLTDEAGNWLARIACGHAQALAASPSAFFDLLYRSLAAPGCNADRCVDVLRALKCVADACPDDPAMRLPARLESAILAEAIACAQFSGLVGQGLRVRPGRQIRTRRSSHLDSHVELSLNRLEQLRETRDRTRERRGIVDDPNSNRVGRSIGSTYDRPFEPYRNRRWP